MLHLLPRRRRWTMQVKPKTKTNKHTIAPTMTIATLAAVFYVRLNEKTLKLTSKLAR